MLLSTSVSANSLIYWAMTDFPPFYILKGPYTGHGSADKVQQLLQSALTGYQHKRFNVNVERMESMLDKGYQICNVNMLKTPEREQSMYFSRYPVGVVLSSGLITTKNKRQLFPDGESIHFSDVLGQRKIIGGVSEGRSFGPVIDKLLHGAASGKVIFRSSEDLTSGLLSMLERGRIDYLLGYDHELKYLTHLNGDGNNANRYTFIPLAEQPRSQFSYATCSKSSFGRKVIDEIDHILEGVISTPEYADIWLRWTTNPTRYAEEFTRLQKYTAQFQ